MKARHALGMCCVVLGVAFSLQSSIGTAEVINDDLIVPLSQNEAGRLKVQNFMDRAEVRDRLKSFGVTDTLSRVRVAAMTDEEVHAMADKIDTMPAGGRVHDSDLVLILLIIILILLI